MSELSKEPLDLTVEPEEAGQRLDQFLANRIPLYSRMHLRRVISAGGVTIGDNGGKPAYRLRAGEVVRIVLPELPRSAPIPEQIPLTVLYEDDDIVAINKPPGMVVHPSRGHWSGTLTSALAFHFDTLSGVGGANRPGIVHRLDRDTTGVMVIAKTEAAMVALRQQWKDRTVEKEYRCIVFGEPRFHSDWIERAIATDPRHGDRMTVVDEGGRDAATYYEVVEGFGQFAHVLCRPKTGRTHQIRVHMTAIGHSLVGDRIYRSRSRQHESLPEGAPSPGRQCLHALRLRFDHPATQERMDVQAPMPADITALLEWLRAQPRSAAR